MEKNDSIAFVTGTPAKPVATRFVNASVYVVCEIPVKCNVQPIANGLTDRMVIQYQEAVTYSCLNNLALVGDAVQSCLENGSLSSVGPSCNSCKASAADFTTGLGGYTQATSSDQFDWTRNQGGTSSGETGPLSDHSSGSGHY
eukprot:scpid98227/ scgid3360/ 